MSVQELKKLAPGFAWEKFLTETKMAKLTRVVVAEKSAFPKIVEVYAKAPIDTIRAWEVFHLADNAAPYLSKPFTDAYFELHAKTLSGQKEQQARWKRGITTVSGGDFGVGDRFGTFGTMGFGVGQLYTAQYFPADAKAKIQDLVANLKNAYRARIEKLDWMGAETKKEALKKLDTYTIKVGYPDHPRDYSKLVIRGDDLVGNVKRCAQLDWGFYTGRFFSPVDRTDWSMTPQTNDAYNGSLRDIVFRPEFFSRRFSTRMPIPQLIMAQPAGLSVTNLLTASTIRAARSMHRARCAIGGQPKTRKHSKQERTCSAHNFQNTNRCREFM